MYLLTITKEKKFKAVNICFVLNKSIVSKNKKGTSEGKGDDGREILEGKKSDNKKERKKERKIIDKKEKKEQ